MAKRNRTRILLLFLALATLVECNKSEGSKPSNLFGATPQVSDVVITKARKVFHCENQLTELCDCCCVPDPLVADDAEIDQVTATAKIQDKDGISNVLVVLLRFFDQKSGLPALVSLEMFDTGPGDLVPDPGVQLSGDLVAGDGIYTRSFYFSSSTASSAGSCVADTDQSTLGGMLTDYQSSLTILPSESQEIRFTVQAIDLQGNIGSGPEITLPIQGTFRDEHNLSSKPCGPQKQPPPGCLPPP